jgi:hypothetical protein
VHTAQEGLLLVAAEIVADALAQSGVDLLQRPVAVLCAAPLVGIVGELYSPSGLSTPISG